MALFQQQRAIGMPHRLEPRPGIGILQRIFQLDRDALGPLDLVDDLQCRLELIAGIFRLQLQRNWQQSFAHIDFTELIGASDVIGKHAPIACGNHANEPSLPRYHHRGLGGRADRAETRDILPAALLQRADKRHRRLLDHRSTPQLDMIAAQPVVRPGCAAHKR